MSELAVVAWHGSRKRPKPTKWMIPRVRGHTTRAASKVLQWVSAKAAILCPKSGIPRLPSGHPPAPATQISCSNHSVFARAAQKASSTRYGKRRTWLEDLDMPNTPIYMPRFECLVAKRTYLLAMPDQRPPGATDRADVRLSDTPSAASETKRKVDLYGPDVLNVTSFVASAVQLAAWEVQATLDVDDLTRRTGEASQLTAAQRARAIPVARDLGLLANRLCGDDTTIATIEGLDNSERALSIDAVERGKSRWTQLYDTKASSENAPCVLTCGAFDLAREALLVAMRSGSAQAEENHQGANSSTAPQTDFLSFLGAPSATANDYRPSILERVLNERMSEAWRLFNRAMTHIEKSQFGDFPSLATTHKGDYLRDQMRHIIHVEASERWAQREHRRGSADQPMTTVMGCCVENGTLLTALEDTILDPYNVHDSVIGSCVSLLSQYDWLHTNSSNIDTTSLNKALEQLREAYAKRKELAKESEA